MASNKVPQKTLFEVVQNTDDSITVNINDKQEVVMAELTAVIMEMMEDNNDKLFYFFSMIIFNILALEHSGRLQQDFVDFLNVAVDKMRKNLKKRPYNS